MKLYLQFMMMLHYKDFVFIEYGRRGPAHLTVDYVKVHRVGLVELPPEQNAHHEIIGDLSEHSGASLYC